MSLTSKEAAPWTAPVRKFKRWSRPVKGKASIYLLGIQTLKRDPRQSAQSMVIIMTYTVPASWESKTPLSRNLFREDDFAVLNPFETVTGTELPGMILHRRAMTPGVTTLNSISIFTGSPLRIILDIPRASVQSVSSEKIDREEKQGVLQDTKSRKRGTNTAMQCVWQ